MLLSEIYYTVDSLPLIIITYYNIIQNISFKIEKHAISFNVIYFL